MKTNDIFNFRRFGKYFASDIKGCTVNFGLSLLTISLLLPVALYMITTAFNLILNSAWEGPSAGLRIFIFAVAVFCIVVTMPVKCYGKITEKQYGSFWITLPASRLEKFISMFLMTCLIVPLAGVVLYLGVDALICSLDHSCGSGLAVGAVNLLKDFGNLKEVTINLVDEGLEIYDAELAKEVIGQISSPWLYIDEIFEITLPFLLGALYFKSGKTVKTFLAMFAVSMAVSSILTPLMTDWTIEIMDQLESSDGALVLRSMFSSGLFKKLVLIDNISGFLINTAMMIAIWFRIKTIKH